MKKIVIALSVLALLTSCVSKKYTDLEARNKETQDLLNTCTVKLNSCLEESGSYSYSCWFKRLQPNVDQ
jgi:chemotaxis protein MotB